MEDEFSVSAGFHDGCRVLVVRGEVDELTAPALIEAMDGEPDGWPLIVDLTAVTFISSAGLHAVLRGRQDGRAIVCPPGNIARVLDLIQANRKVPIFLDLDSAILSVSLSKSA
jgi:anti-anti-sigma factor